jgi:hypothetical protein
MRYAMRICLLDRPGMLGALATALGLVDVDIVTLEVIDRADGTTVDDLCVEAPIEASELVAVCERVPGVVVEALSAVPLPRTPTTLTGLAARIAEAPGAAVARLVAGLPGALGGTWAVAVTDSSEGVEVVAACDDAPTIPAALRLPFLPLTKPRRLPQAQWMPAMWRTSTQDRLEIAAAPLEGPVSTVLLARMNGARFRAGDLQRMSELSRVAVAADARARTPLSSV